MSQLLPNALPELRLQPGIMPDSLPTYLALLDNEVPRRQLANSLSRKAWNCSDKGFPYIMSEGTKVGIRYVSLTEASPSVKFTLHKEKLHRVHMRIDERSWSAEQLEKGRAGLQVLLTWLCGEPLLDSEVMANGFNRSTWRRGRIACTLEAAREHFYAKIRIHMEMGLDVPTLDHLLVY